MGAFETVLPGAVEAKVEHHLVMSILLTCKRTAAGG